MKIQKTNAMRLLDSAGIEYGTSSYDYDESDLSGTHAAEMLGIDPGTMFKTIVTRGKKRGLLVFCIPVCEELDLKKASACAGDKRIELVHVKELFALTGYVRGGCSPIGMKKLFPTFIDESAVLYDKIYVSAGIRGAQLILSPGDLTEFVHAKLCDITRI